MHFEHTPRFNRSFAAAPTAIQQAFLSKAGLLLRDLRHPSLHAKKYDEARDIWQARITRAWRFYFTIEADTYVLLDMAEHPK
jgi:hypothetical protein